MTAAYSGRRSLIAAFWGSFSSLSTCQHDALSDACFDVAPSVARSTGTHARRSGEGVRDRLERIRAVFRTGRVGRANILVHGPVRLERVSRYRTHSPLGRAQPVALSPGREAAQHQGKGRSALSLLWPPNELTPNVG